MADTYTHKGLAELCDVSETTIKSYRRKFPGFIPVLTKGKPIRFKSEAGDVCLKIRDCFAKGLSVNETYKTLKGNFKEAHSTKQQRTSTPSASSNSSSVSEEYLEKFFKTAGQMMQGMAGLATAQAKAEHRLRKVESTLKKLLELEIRNNETFGRLLEQNTTAPSAPTPEPVSSFTSPSESESEPKVRARKIVNVHNPEGEVQSYALEKDETIEPGQPIDAFLNTPIVIRNNQGEFLGVPSKLSLAEFVEILVREAEEGGTSLTSWSKQDDVWLYTMESPDNETHILHFTSTTTPRGNLVVLLNRLDVNGKQTSRQFLQEFFRQVMDKA